MDELSAVDEARRGGVDQAVTVAGDDDRSFGRPGGDNRVRVLDRHDGDSGRIRQVGVEREVQLVVQRQLRCSLVHLAGAEDDRLAEARRLADQIPQLLRPWRVVALVLEV